MTGSIFIAVMIALAFTLMLAGVIITAIGAFFVFTLLRPLKAPADTSNRINRIRLVWFALTRPELFVEFFNWLKNDELDNINASRQSHN
jgi:Ca2+/Na+ antiporter